MRRHNSLLHCVLLHGPRAAFDRLVEEHGADQRVRRFPTRSQFIARLYEELAGAASLRDIETALVSHASRLSHVGAHTHQLPEARGRCHV